MAENPFGDLIPGSATAAPAPQQRRGYIPGVPKAPTPLQLEDQQLQRQAASRAANADARAAGADARSADAAQRSALDWQATHNPDGTPKLGTGDAKVTEYQAKSAGFLGRMMQAEGEFSGVPEGSRDARTIPGQWFHDTMPGLENSFNSGDRQKADQAARNFIAASLRQESGAAISQGEYDNQYRIFFPMPGDGPEVIAQKAEARRQAIEGFRVSAGPLADKIAKGVGDRRDGAPMIGGAVQPPASGAPPAPPAGPSGPAPLSGGDPSYQAATGSTRTVEDPETQAHVDALLRQGVSFGDVNKYAVSRGMEPVKPQEYAAVRKFLRENPNYQGSLVNAQKYAPLSATEQAITKVGDNPVGTYLMNAGQFLSGNTLDNLASDPERARLAVDMGNAQNPNAAAAGQITGGIMAGATGEAGLARLGMAGGFGRGLLADMAMGGANGAGAADSPDQSRLAGAAKGAAVAAAGNVAGTGVAKAAGRAFNPSGGSLADLYAAGVRPTIGQRVANANNGKGFSGMVGKAVNATEEALQSVPIVGSAIKGARQVARDQFQAGAFNQALSEVGEQLPTGMRPGTDPHKFTQEVFNRVYDRARSGMTMVADNELKNDLGNLAPEIATLGPQAANKLKAIMANSVNNKLVNGQMAGNAYKQAMSDLGKHIARLGKSSMAEDQQLADILGGVQGAVDAAARRSSHPDAVALLDAADAGYAKFVRIEEAAQRKGGDAGTFSPAGFDSAVQKTSGGVRSKAYLRGDALMQDYAKAGRSLEDRLPNSGSADRIAMGTAAAGGAAYLEPTTLAVLGTIGTAYAPGVRKAMQGAMAPSNSATAKAISAQLKKRARLVGAAGASTAVAALPGTAPGQ